MNFPPEQQWKVGLTETETKMLIPSEEELEGLGWRWPKKRKIKRAFCDMVATNNDNAVYLKIAVEEILNILTSKKHELTHVRSFI